jgi:hypothetical protein
MGLHPVSICDDIPIAWAIKAFRVTLRQRVNAASVEHTGLTKRQDHHEQDSGGPVPLALAAVANLRVLRCWTNGRAGERDIEWFMALSSSCRGSSERSHGTLF